MSSIDRSNDNEVRKTREQYTQKESESVKKHKLEMKRLADAHQAEVDKLRQAHDKEMQNIRGLSVEAINKRDMKYQKQIEDLRSLHGQQLKKLAQETETRSKTNDSSKDQEIARVKLTAEQQKDQAVGNVSEELHKKEKAYQQLVEDTREGQATALERQRDRIEKARGQEKEIILNERNQEVARKDTDFFKYRNEAERKLNETEESKMRQRDKLSNLLHETVAEEQASHQLQQDLQREAFKAGMEKNRERYDKALAKNSQSLESARSTLEGSVNKRLDDKVESLESRVNRLKAEKSLERIALEGQKKRELESVKGSYAKQFDLVEQQKRDFVEDVNQKTSRDFDRLNKKNQEIMHKQNSFYQDKLGIDELRSETRYSQQKVDSESKHNRAVGSANRRYDQMKNVKDIEAEKLRNFFEQNSQAMRENFEDSLRELRLQNKKEQETIFSTTSQRSSETEQVFQNKINDIAVTYEKRIAELEAKHQADMKDIQGQSERRLKEQSKKDQSEFASQNAQLSYRLSKQNEIHQRELDELRRSHKEALAQVSKPKQG